MNNLLGQRFERLLVLKRKGSDANRRSLWICQCDCGKSVLVNSWKLKRGVKKSCGCLYRESVHRKEPKFRTHGLRNEPVYYVWHNMLTRCRKSESYKRKGITLEDPRWSDLSCFVADMGFPLPGLSLARRDPKRGFYKENCYWQTTNRAKAINASSLLTYQGETKTTAEWSSHFKVKHKNFVRRLLAGWSVERAGSTPVAKRNKARIRPELPVGKRQVRKLYHFDYQHK